MSKNGEPSETVSAFPVVVFDLDGTLLLGTTVSLLLAEWLGRTAEIARLEEAFRANEITNSVIAETSAAWFAGQRTEEIWRVLGQGPWIDGMTETFQALRASGVSLLLGTITWSFAAEMLSEHYGFAAVSGTEMQAANGILSGTISRPFDEHDKLHFVEKWCARRGISMDQVAAIGDSRSDIPLFRRAGLSIALNATPDAREIATHILETDDLRDALPLLSPQVGDQKQSGSELGR
jgi:phosphoserine phosphatase